MTKPPAPVCIVTVRDMLVRLYAHPSVEHGRPWCALADLLGLASYSADECQTMADEWCSAYPDLAVVAGDGAAIVSGTVVIGHLDGWSRGASGGCRHPRRL